MLAKYLELNKKVAVWRSRPRQNVKNAFSRRSRAVTAKKCIKKSVIHVQSCCFANLNLLLFCRPRCLRYLFNVETGNVDLTFESTTKIISP